MKYCVCKKKTKKTRWLHRASLSLLHTESFHLSFECFGEMWSNSIGFFFSFFFISVGFMLSYHQLHHAYICGVKGHVVSHTEHAVRLDVYFLHTMQCQTGEVFAVVKSTRCEDWYSCRAAYQKKERAGKKDRVERVEWSGDCSQRSVLSAVWPLTECIREEKNKKKICQTLTWTPGQNTRQILFFLALCHMADRPSPPPPPHHPSSPLLPLPLFLLLHRLKSTTRYCDSVLWAYRYLAWHAVHFLMPLPDKWQAKRKIANLDRDCHLPNPLESSSQIHARPHCQQMWPSLAQTIGQQLRSWKS